MAYTNNRDDGEKYKFRRTEDNNTVVATTPHDLDGNSIHIDANGNVRTNDDELLCVMKDILLQMKIMNVHLAEMRGETINKEDIE